MATRFFFPETEAAAVSPAIQGTYLHTNTVRRRLRSTVDASTLTSTAYTPDSADHAVAGASHVRQYVSDSLNAQTISGTWKAQIQGFEPNANCNQTINVMIFVCDSAGTTIKETLFAQAAVGTELVATTLTNRTLTGSITSANIEANDRIVVQIGTSGTPAGGGGVQGHNSTLRWGCNASSGDLPEDETQTGTTYRAWIEFSATLLPQTYDEGTTLTATNTITEAVSNTIETASTFAATGACAPVAALVVEPSLTLTATPTIDEAGDVTSSNTYNEEVTLDTANADPVYFRRNMGYRRQPFILEDNASFWEFSAQPENIIETTVAASSTQAITPATEAISESQVTLTASNVFATQPENVLDLSVPVFTSTQTIDAVGDVTGAPQTYEGEATLTATNTYALQSDAALLGETTLAEANTLAVQPENSIPAAVAALTTVQVFDTDATVTSGPQTYEGAVTLTATDTFTSVTDGAFVADATFAETNTVSVQPENDISINVPSFDSTQTLVADGEITTGPQTYNESTTLIATNVFALQVQNILDTAASLPVSNTFSTLIQNVIDTVTELVSAQTILLQIQNVLEVAAGFTETCTYTTEGEVVPGAQTYNESTTFSVNNLFNLSSAGSDFSVDVSMFSSILLVIEATTGAAGVTSQQVNLVVETMKELQSVIHTRSAIPLSIAKAKDISLRG